MPQSNRFKVFLDQMWRALTEPHPGIHDPATRRAQEHSADYFRALTEYSNDLIAVIQPDATLRYISPSIQHLLGYAPDELTGESVLKLVHPDDVPAAIHALQERLAEGGVAPVRMELRVRHKDGDYRAYELRGNNQLTHPLIQGLIVNARDITNRQRAAEALRASEARYRALVEDAGEMITRYAPDGTLTFVNAAYSRLFGKTPAELIGTNFVEQRAGEQRAQLRHFVDAFSVATPIQTYEFRDEAPNGTVRWRQWIDRALLDENGVVVEIQGVGRDITALKLAEEELRKSEQKFSKFFHANPAGIGIGEIRTGRFLDMNERYAEFFGYTREELMQSSAIDLWADPRDRDGVIAQLRETGSVRNVEGRFRRKTGEIIYGLLSMEAVPLFEEPVAIAMLIDITERKRAEVELARRASEFQALYEVGRDFAELQDLPKLLQTIVERAEHLLRSSNGAMFHYDPAQQELEITYTTRIPTNRGMRIKIGEGLSGRVAQLRAPVRVTDYATWEHRWAKTARVNLRAAIGAPMLYAGELIGVLQLAEDQESPRVFTQADERLLALLATQAAGAVRNARLFEQEQRARQIAETLRRAGSALSASLNLQTVLHSFLSELRVLVPYDGANVMFLERGDWLVVVAAAGYTGWSNPDVIRAITLDVKTLPHLRHLFSARESVTIADTHLDPGWNHRLAEGEKIRNWLGVPLIAGGEILGMLSCDKATPGFFTAEHIRMVEALAPQAAAAMQNARLFDQINDQRNRLRLLAHQAINTQERERARVSRELHDQAGQTLTALTIGLAMIESDLPKKPATLRAQMADVVDMANTTLEDVRRLARALRPPALDAASFDLVLREHCAEFTRRTRLPVAFPSIEIPELSDPAKTTLYRFLQEALTNILKHAHAKQVSVELNTRERMLYFSVQDDGQGMAQRPRGGGAGTTGIGLLGIEERLGLLGGRLEIDSRPGAGTRITAWVPVEAR
ncbi:MAG: PAS domain S-box protein [Chloroflexi bacterium]|nr:PAS domain S-box protein [Chloroflexota bacterium]